MIKPSRQPAISPIRSSKTWGCKVKLPDKSRYAVSLRVPWPGNVREAEARAAELQRDVDNRSLAESLRWLGERSAETLKIRLGLRMVDRDDDIRTICGDPTTWWEARSAWLLTYPERKLVAGKVADPDFTRKGYESRTRIFCKWADEVRLKLRGKSATTATILFLRARRSGGTAASKGGVSPGSLDNDIRVLHTWFGWLQRRGWTDQMDKDAIYGDEVFAGDDEGGENFIPDWKLDLATLQKMYSSRFDSDASLSAWRLYVLVRGLGCRPKEAFTLSWDTVQVEEGLVTFRNVKEERLKSKRRGRSRRAVRDRSVPIVFQWVQDALNEIKSLGAKRGTAVAVNTEGTHHKGAAQAANAFGRQLRVIGIKRSGYSLKASQRAAIVHLEQVLPPWIVARIAGHSLDIHMAHYSTNDSHLPSRKDREYGRFDMLSPAGREMAAKYQQPALLKRMLDQGKL
jgi:integrase